MITTIYRTTSYTSLPRLSALPLSETRLSGLWFSGRETKKETKLVQTFFTINLIFNLGQGFWTFRKPYSTFDENADKISSRNSS